MGMGDRKKGRTKDMITIRLNQIKLPVLHEPGALDAAVKKKLHRKEVPAYQIVKRSIDARDKEHLQYIYCVEVTEETLSPKQLSRFGNDKNIMLTNKTKYSFDSYIRSNPEANQEQKSLKHPPVIVGTGPAGLFCGYLLAKAGYQPILVERGKRVDERQEIVEKYWQGGPLQPDCNVQFGEGGAGTFSDGKLNTMIKDKTGRIDAVLRTFAEYGADSEILYVNKPHIGTDRLREVVRAMRTAIEAMGGTFLFDTCFLDYELDATQSVCGVRVRHGEQLQTLPCECVVLAIGHSARDTFYQLQEHGLYMTPKAFAVGLRIEHEASMIQQAQYGNSKEAKQLPAADYKLTHQTPDKRAVYSFCMCPGGHIVDASSEPGQIAVNGMSYHDRAARNSNSAIVVNVTPEDFAGTGPLAGIEFQRSWERAAYQAGQGRVPLQLLGDYMENKTTTGLGAIMPDICGQYAFANLNECLPKFVNDAIINGIMSFEHRIQSFARPDAILCGIESRTSSPVRIERNEKFISNVSGIYPCGEGAGYAGGITSAAVDGMKVAEAIATQFCPHYE